MPPDDDRPVSTGWDAHVDARALVRLVQCSQCSSPLKQPMTLPCGDSLCRTCLPPLHRREHISYPDTVERRQGFRCPLASCGLEHSVADCSIDVTLTKLVNVVDHELARYRALTTETPLWVEEKIGSDEVQARGPSSPVLPRARVLHGGRLVATYTFADMGELRFDAEVAYTPLADTTDDHRPLDQAVFERLQEATRMELDCQVCYHLLWKPVTTTCGHTFCRPCLQRVLDHSDRCPICRRTLTMSPSLLRLEPGNRRLWRYLTALFPDAVAARTELMVTEEMAAATGGEFDTPIFVCTLSFPSMPTFLHVFEPRYRLMMRRVVDSDSRTFGMVSYNHSGDAGSTPFMEYGTLLHIVNMHLLSDGRSLIESVGLSRFRLGDWDWRDGYMVARVERVEDVSVAEEERAEAAETSQAISSSSTSSPTSVTGSPATGGQVDLSISSSLDTWSTRALLEVGLEFVSKMRARSAPWLYERVLATYSDPPDDPALFPFWLASLLPISDQEKYPLLSITSVRNRLKVTVRWIKRIEGQRWWVLSFDSIL